MTWQRYPVFSLLNSHFKFLPLRNAYCCQLSRATFSSQKDRKYSTYPKISLVQKHVLKLNQCSNRSLFSLPKVPKEGFLNYYGQFLVDSAPREVRPYLRLARIDKPAGFWFVMWPGLVGLAMGSLGHLPGLWVMTKFSIGAILMRSIGCTINDLWDQDLDKMVSRTKTRPLASSELTVNQALVSGVLQSVAALGILLTFNSPTIALGFCAVPLVVAYPYMKRITYYPQAFLGLCINYGVLMGCTATNGSLTLPACTMFASLVSWTIFYDTIYALQDKKDDLFFGVKSTAIKFGDDVHKYLYLFSGISTSGLLLSGYLAQMGPLYYAGVGFVSHLWLSQVNTLDPQDSADCMKKFVQNTPVGVTLFLSAVLGGIFSF